mgnify:CR=1 FL=1
MSEEEAKRAARPTRRQLQVQLADASWVAALLAVSSLALTLELRASKPAARSLIGALSVGFWVGGALAGLAALVMVLLGRSRRARRVWLPALTGVALCVTSLVVDAVVHGDRHVYLDPHGLPRVYRMRPAPRGESARGVLIYLHGAGGTEDQGLDPRLGGGTFARLFRELDARGWAYVCPRDAELDGLVAKLREEHEGAPLYLAGASMGGRQAFAACARAGHPFAGVILLCPAMNYQAKGQPPASLPATWLVCGDADTISTGPSRELAQDLSRRASPPGRYRELPGGDHGSPLREVDWGAALDLVAGGR